MSKENNEEVILCVSNSYQQRYYLNPLFGKLPPSVLDELKVMCVLYTEDVGGVLELFFDEEGNLDFRTTYEESDYYYDEIGSVLKIKQYQREKQDLMEALELYYRITFLGQGLEE